MSGKLALLLFAISLAELCPAFAATPQDLAASRADVELQHIEKNAELTHPDRTPTRFTDEEINAYIASGRVKLPDGVESVKFEGQPAIVTATCRVDFDQVKAGRRSGNPLLSIFSGVHDVVVTAQASGSNGQGLVDVQSVSFDGVEIPRFILQLFVEKYLQPQYPNVGLQSRFALPDRIDYAVVGERSLTVTQK